MAERFPETDDKVAQYEATGRILADTAIGIGVELSLDDRERWAHVLGRIAVADDMFEENRETFSATSLMNYLGMGVQNTSIRDATDRLL